MRRLAVDRRERAQLEALLDEARGRERERGEDPDRGIGAGKRAAQLEVGLGRPDESRDVGLQPLTRVVGEPVVEAARIGGDDRARAARAIRPGFTREGADRLHQRHAI